MATATALAGSSLSSFSLRSKLSLPSTRLHPSAKLSPPSPSFPKLSFPSPLPLTDSQISLGGSTLAGALFASLASSDSAFAAQQIIQLAADDNRGASLLIPLVPAVAWVLYNILQPALNQIDRMKSVKGLGIGLGLGAAAASLLVAPHASAAEEIATLAADSDSRGTLLLGILLPAIGWVLYNILQPALNQVDKMRSSKGIVGAIGLGAASTLFFSPQADAAVQEIANIADNDSRGLLLLGIIVPAIGWVLFNILQPLLNQVDKMRSAKGIVGTIGLGAAATLFAPQADAAVQEIANIADGDSRGTLLLGILIPAIGWVLYNILQPALNQVNKMRSGK